MHYLNLNKVNEEVKRIFIPFSDEILNVDNENILSIALYGSAVSPDYVVGKSDINSLFVFKEYNFDIFKRCCAIYKKAAKRMISPPLFLSPSMIDESVDVFPMEFSEIKDCNILIFGEDFFKDLNISYEHLRLQCEQQIKGRLLLLGQAFLETGRNGKRIEMLMVESISSIFPILRSALKLKGIDVPSSKDEIISLVEKNFEIENSIMRDILKDKKGDGKIGRFNAENAFSKYFNEITKIALIINEL